MTYSGYVFYDKKGIEFSNSEKDLILENVIRVLNTRRGERLNNLAFGSDISKYIFMPEISTEDLVAEIVNSLARCEPRVKVLNVSFETDDTEETVKINLHLLINNKEQADLSVSI